jgi:competence protein ComEC
VVVPFLLAHGIHRVDYVVATHADRDHIGGLVHVLEELHVGALVLGPKPSGKALEQKLITVARENNIPVQRVTAGTELDMRAARAEVLHPPPEYAPGTGSNDQSIVIRLTWPGLSVLLPGDIEWDAEQRVAGLDCAAAVLKAPHHGSSTSSGEPLIAAVDPDHAVISTRPTSSRGGTGAGVLERYAAHDVQVWRTDRHGGLRLTVEAGRLVFTGARISRGYTTGP